MLQQRLFTNAILLASFIALSSLGMNVLADEPVEEEPVESEQLADEPVEEEPVESEQLADEPVEEEPMESEQLADEPVESELIIQEQEADQLITDTVIGTRVYNISDENVGSIDNLLIDSEGRVVGAVLSVGGFLGFGSKKVAVSWDHLTFHTMEGIARLDSDINREWLEEAPEFRTQEQIERERQAELARQEQEMQQPMQE